MELPEVLKRGLKIRCTKGSSRGERGKARGEKGRGGEMGSGVRPFPKGNGRPGYPEYGER